MAKSKERVLKKAETIQGTTFQPGTSIKLDEEGNLERVVLGADQKIMDVHYAATMPDVYKTGTVIEYWGALKPFNKKSEVPDKITVQEEHKIYGFAVPAFTSLVLAAVFGGFEEDPDTKYEVMYMQAQLGDDVILKKKQFQAGEYVRLYPGNKIVFQGADGEDKEI